MGRHFLRGIEWALFLPRTVPYGAIPLLQTLHGGCKQLPPDAEGFFHATIHYIAQPRRFVL
jgi:hypothetical protein